MILNISRLQDDDEEHLEHLTIWLSNELNDLDIERVEVIDSGKAPEGTKGIPEIPVWGTLLIDLLPGVIPFIIGTSSTVVKTRRGPLGYDGD